MEWILIIFWMGFTFVLFREVKRLARLNDVNVERFMADINRLREEKRILIENFLGEEGK